MCVRNFGVCGRIEECKTRRMEESITRDGVSSEVVRLSGTVSVGLILLAGLCFFLMDRNSHCHGL